MFQVIAAIVTLLAIALIKKIPKIGGNISAGLFLAGVVTMLCAGIFNPAEWILAWIDGLNRIAWIMGLAITGGIFAEISGRLGTVDTIIGVLNAKFSNKPRALVVSIMLVLVIAGSLLGDATAAAAVIGALTIGVLVSMNISLEKISAMIVMGAALGSIMPPMTQAIALSSTLCNTDPDPVVNIAYFTVGACVIVCCFYTSMFLIKKENKPGANPGYEIKLNNMTAGEILKGNWKSLIPVTSLVIIVLMRTLPFIKIDLGPIILGAIKFTFVKDSDPTTLYDLLKSTTILTGLSNGIVLCIILAIFVSFAFPVIRNNAGEVLKTGLHNVMPCVGLQIFCAFMLGAFYYAGSIDIVTNFAMGLNANLLKIGGSAAMLLIGMLTGSQTTAQNAIFSFFGPSLVAIGRDPTLTAVAGAHLAMSGQGMPPADLTTFVVCGLISAQVNKKVDPLKSMLYSMPMCICFLIVGMIFLYI